MKELVEKVEKFIKDNELEFSGESSELNGNCTILGGFICHVVFTDGSVSVVGENIIDELPLSIVAKSELQRVYEFAWVSNYENFWETEEAKEQYVF